MHIIMNHPTHTPAPPLHERARVSARADAWGGRWGELRRRRGLGPLRSRHPHGQPQHICMYY